jgi:hypothetical protein
MRSDHEIIVLLKAVSPITHMSGTEGNEAVIMREPVCFDGETRWVPVLTGNSLRHCMIREPGMLDLISRAGMSGKLSLSQYNFLLHGGALSKSTKASDLKRSRLGRELMPLFSILGGSLDNEIVSGWMDVGRGNLVCLENQGRLKLMYPEISENLADVYGGSGEHLLPAETFVAPYQYTRGDASKWIEESASDQTNLMIFSGQQINPGAAFITRITLRNCGEMELGALLCAIELWSGVVGGQRSRGHGLVIASYSISRGSKNDDAQRLIDGYISHTETNAGNISSWMNSAFCREEGTLAAS